MQAKGLSGKSFDIAETLGTALPIIQAPMAGVQDSRLCIAVSEAGGLGSLAAAMLSPERLEQELHTITAQTNKPYNVNFFCHRLPAPSSERMKAWHTTLQDYFDRYQLPLPEVTNSPMRQPFNEQSLAILERFQPAVVSFHFGLPAPEMLARVKAMGSKVIASATTLEEALWLEQHGADAIIAQGLEAGGHRGVFLDQQLSKQVGTFSLVPQLVAAVSLPVIAAGGIATVEGVRAALALGACAVQVGTAYLLCPETQTSEIHRAALKSDAARHTAITNVFSGRPARSIVNRVMQEIGPMCASAPEFPQAAAAMAQLRSKAEAQGLNDFSSLWCGQNASGCEEIPAAELTRRLGKISY